MYGTGLLTRSPAVVAALPKWLQISVPYANAVNTYMIVVVAFIAFLQLSVGRLRVVIWSIIVAGIGVAIAGIGWFVYAGSVDRFILYNGLVTICGLLVLLTVLAVKKLSDECLVFLNRRVLAAGTLVFVSVALLVNLCNAVRYNLPRVVNHLGFAVFLLSLGYVGVQMVFASERRLLSIDRELAIAREIQESLLPKEIPQVVGFEVATAWRPARAVGGDYFDVLRLDERRLAVCIADVVGKGMSAALLMANVQATVRAFAHDSESPASVCSRVNSVLCENIAIGKFVTFFYGILDAEKHSLQYCDAGHPYPILVSSNSVQQLRSGGAVLGVFPEWKYEDSAVTLHSADKLLLFTDGISEAVGRGGEEFGEDKLAALASSQLSGSVSEMNKQVLDQVTDFCGGHFQDDATVLVIGVK